MGRKSIDRTGEKNINTFGSEMVIVGYRNTMDIDVYFSKYDCTFKNATYQSFKNGQIRCPYERRVYGIGYIGEGKYKAKENGKRTRVYDAWYSMLKRCYSDKLHEKHPTYKNCSVTEKWHNFQNFGKWFDNNYYEVTGEEMCLDKDILIKGNKIYSSDTCIFVPHAINSLFVKRDNDRGESVIGTTPFKGKYVAQCSLINPETGKTKREYLGLYNTELEAFEVYKYYKEKNIKEVADYYKDLIPDKLYNAMYEYEVEITD